MADVTLTELRERPTAGGSGDFMGGLRTSLLVAATVAGVAALVAARLRPQLHVSNRIEGVAL